MKKTIDYRGFEIHIYTKPSTAKKVDVWYYVEIENKFEGIAVTGKRMMVHDGPFAGRRALVVGRIAGQAVVDMILDPFTDTPGEIQYGHHHIRA
ncbi:hypothetical protein [Burkholderia plantarii]|uniref:hypothetical protein n=1 Tax=Burkholderia plantarii TaxID=41899 RepID=UPI0005AED46F|nr:hypothetical protein [Burkholderia plantarii]